MQSTFGLDSGNIILIGFMGAGKSSIGRKLAVKQKKKFLDTDEAIATTAGMSIRTIFTQEGEEKFRNRETDILKSLLRHQDMVMATGGGIILRKENRTLLHQLGTVIWLTAEPDILFERAIRSRRRPLLQVKNPRQIFDSLLAFREKLYRQAADLQVDCSYSNHNEIVQKIFEMLASKSRIK